MRYCKRDERRGFIDEIPRLDEHAHGLDGTFW